MLVHRLGSVAWVALVLLAGVLFTLLGCERKPASQSASQPGGGGSQSTLLVVSTTGMIHDLVRVIGGERVSAVGLMGPGVDPHLYKASPADARQLADADLILYNGLHLEGKLADTLVRLARTKPVIAVTERIPEKDLHTPEEMGGHFDPHVWFDVRLWRLAAERVRDALIEVDPAGEAAFRAAFDRYAAELDALHQEILTQIATIPESRRVLVTAHDAFGYFASAYGMNVRAIQGISTEAEASLRDINSLVDMLVADRLPAVFVESSVPRKTMEALVEGAKSRGHDVRIGGELFSDAMGDPGTPEGTYVGMMRHNVRTIVAALAPLPAEPPR